MELSVNSLRERDRLEPQEYLRRVKDLNPRPMGAPEQIGSEPQPDCVADLAGGLLEAVGRLFADNVKIYVHEMNASGFQSHLDSYRTDLNFVSTPEAGRVTVENLRLHAPFDSLYRFLVV